MKHEPLFLTFAEIIEIHDYQIEHFGGGEGLRDIELLKSAIGMPSATFGGEYLHPTILEMAAAYLYHLVENHPFVDGNKRIGAHVMLVFLALNGVELQHSQTELSDVILQLAAGEINAEHLLRWILSHQV